MLDSKTILIIDDSAYGAIDLSAAIEECNGRVAGPAGTVEEALAILDSEEVAAVVVDFELDGSEASALVERLADRHVPFVLQTCNGIPRALEHLNGNIVLTKPVDTRLILDSLVIAIGKGGFAQRHNKLAYLPKQV